LAFFRRNKRFAWFHNPQSASVIRIRIRIRIRNPHPQSASVIRIRNQHPLSASAIRIRNPHPQSVIRNPHPQSDTHKLYHALFDRQLQILVAEQRLVHYNIYKNNFDRIKIAN
jgi:hypothetical protein